MMGLAGIGYGLLRLAAPERVPSVLVLEPPKLKGRGQKSLDYGMADSLNGQVEEELTEELLEAVAAN